MNSQKEDFAEKRSLDASQVQLKVKNGLIKVSFNHINADFAKSLQIEEDTCNSDSQEDASKELEELCTLKEHNGTKIDLLSEIHLNELKEFEILDNEKSYLTTSLPAAELNLEQIEENTSESQDNVKSYIITENFHKSSNKYSLYAHYNSRLTMSSKKIDSLKDYINDIYYSNAININLLVDLHNEITNMESKLLTTEQKSSELQSDVESLTSLSKNAGQLLNSAKNTILGLSEDLAQIYLLVCNENGETPTNMTTDHKNEYMQKDSFAEIQSLFRSDIFIKNLSSIEFFQALADSIQVKKYIETINNEVKYLKAAFDLKIDLNKKKKRVNVSEDKDSHEEVEKLQEQITTLKSLLYTKREQTASLRTILKTNMKTAEIATNNLKSKYEEEKLLVSDKMSKIRNELKTLKEDAATFSSLRTTLAAQCEEYATQVDILKWQVDRVNGEKETLNMFLKVANEDKIEMRACIERVRYAIQTFRITDACQIIDLFLEE